MRLLNTGTLQLKEFIEDSSKLRYAILSHRWGEEEISFQDVTSRDPSIKTKKGCDKLAKCCAQAEKAGFEWVWIDTCCIDKSSSAELSEAINSMYRWYQTASICYAYLNDVTYLPFDFDSTLNELRSSEWFQRGWTLQELVAPKNLHFFDRNWSYFGTKRALAQEITKITSIGVDVLLGIHRPQDRSVAERMSWAAWRQTTRPEDEAYCLLGIFNVNMPLLYGEGRRAFQRLQQEILKQEEDYTILAWLSKLRRGGALLESVDYVHGRLDNSTSVLSSSANDFLYVDNAIEHEDSDLYALLGNKPFDISRIQSPFVAKPLRAEEDAFWGSRNTLSNILRLRPEDLTAPPSVTCRGLKVTLRVWKQALDKYVAWTNCFYVVGHERSLLFCVEIEPIELDGLVFRRKDMSAELHGLNNWDMFMPMELYLSLDYNPTLDPDDVHHDDRYSVFSRSRTIYDVGIYLNDFCPGSIEVRSTQRPGRRQLRDSHISNGAPLNIYVFDQTVAEHSPADPFHIDKAAIYIVKWIEGDCDLSFGIAVNNRRGKYGGVLCQLFSVSGSDGSPVPEAFWKAHWERNGEVSDRLFGGGTGSQPEMVWPSEPVPDRYTMMLSADTLVALDLHYDEIDKSSAPFRPSYLFIEIAIERAHKTPRAGDIEAAPSAKLEDRKSWRKGHGLSRYLALGKT
ncbi:heterokaryon incompatibility protein-domain-containing protein [Cercophora newfieldiana]|uniref:Heterokaryon incompatibility protein-domain-containing protein n=1 Tax=Cercophora newfieldiana TaxID=92897 RepID=A0AA40CKT1_9PEZI|nr:heterokaryon incompatibility protein-domain-containing protein [Cercophora newfieldiana]